MSIMEDGTLARPTTIDPDLLDFVPAELDHSDGMLIDACRRLVNERVGQILSHFDLLAETLVLTKEATLSGNKELRGMSVSYKVTLGEPQLLLIESLSHGRLAFALATRGTEPNTFVTFEQTDEPWMTENFKELIRTLDKKLAQAARKQIKAVRSRQVAAVTALRSGEAILR